MKQLLERGYIVHATCRDPRNRKAVGHLLSLPYAQERLRLFPADLAVPGSFMPAVAGCRYVIHTASPYALECPPGQVSFWRLTVVPGPSQNWLHHPAGLWPYSAQTHPCMLSCRGWHENTLYLSQSLAAAWKLLLCLHTPPPDPHCTCSGAAAAATIRMWAETAHTTALAATHSTG